MDWIKGTVQWFDDSSGEGMVITGNTSYYVHYSAIESKDKFKSLKKGVNVEFQLYENLYMKQVDKIREI